MNSKDDKLLKIEFKGESYLEWWETRRISCPDGSELVSGYISVDGEPDTLWQEESGPDGESRFRHCGIGEGCFWTDWE